MANIEYFYTFAQTMKRSKQLSLDKKQFKPKLEFGGKHLATHNAREARPVSTSKPMHLVLRSSRAKGEWSFLKKKNRLSIENYIRKFSKGKGIRVYQAANSGNHLHLVIRVGTRRLFSPFIRALAGSIAISISGASKKNQIGDEKFWDFRPWTRVGEWGKAYSLLKDYVLRNHLEAIGMIPYDRSASTREMLRDFG